MWQEQDSSDDGGARLKSFSIGLLHPCCRGKSVTHTHANLGKKGSQKMIEYRLITQEPNNLGFWIRGLRGVAYK